jgi:hypothetical protein
MRHFLPAQTMYNVDKKEIPALKLNESSTARKYAI